MDVPTAPQVTAQTIYHPRRGLIIMASVVLFFICLGFVPLLVSTLLGLPSTPSSTRGGTIISAILLACILAVFVFGYIAILRMRIVTSAEGIAFYCLPYHLSTSWQNIGAIGERVNRQGRRFKVLELRQQAETFASNRWFGFISTWLNRPGTYIPLDYFVTQGKEDSSRLLDEVNGHAEQATTTKKKKAKKR
jgi:hypothetical protein